MQDGLLSSCSPLVQPRASRTAARRAASAGRFAVCHAGSGAEDGGRTELKRRAVVGILSASLVNAFVPRSRAEELELAAGPARAPDADSPPPQPISQPAAPTGTVRQLSDEERILLEQNQRIKSLNRAPSDFPAFIRKGYSVTVLADGYTYQNDGLIYKDFKAGTGEQPVDGQQVTFHYTAYNEQGGKIDSSYNKGQPAQTRLGINGMIPGFEAAIKSMRTGGKRRVIVPPELGPPVGPSTFFSAKQFEVFDVELLARARLFDIEQDVRLFDSRS